MRKTRYWMIVASMAFSGVASAEVGVGLSVTVGQPGFYGTIDIGNAPPPVLYSPQAVLVQPMVGVPPQPPIYLRVPLGHRKDWRHHCAEYNACGRPVYFVRDSWYSNVYAPHYQQHREYYQGRHEYENQHQGRPNERERGGERGDERGREGPGR